MNRLLDALKGVIQGLMKAVTRFPLTVICLITATSLVCYMISLQREPSILIEKLLFTCLLGAFLGVVTQFSCERFARLEKMRLWVYVGAAMLVGVYFWSLSPAQSIRFDVQIRTFIAVFAMFSLALFIPSYRDGFDFDDIALIHFKAAFTAVLYAVVLSIGCVSIIAAIDILLFNINQDAYGYTMAIIWILFALLYYLSLLPRFNSAVAEEQEYAREACAYPRILQILVSYITIPLIAVYTLVLFAYFIKILFTLHWPVGQLGPMVLAYSAAGLIVYILAGKLENRAAGLYRMLFPKMLIPIVIMQLVSVVIRLNAYGITESRYYVALFGVYALICAVILSLRPIAKNGLIVLLAAVLAILSIVPPLDAFNVSRVSQTNRLENMLQTEGVLVEGKIIPQADASQELKIETTNILRYLQNRNYLEKIAWLPANFEVYNDLQDTFGFAATYPQHPGEADYFYAALNVDEAIAIDDYDVMLAGHSYRGQGKTDINPVDFTVNNIKYQLNITRVSAQETRIAIKDAEGQELVGSGLYDFALALRDLLKQSDNSLSPEKLTLVSEQNGYKLCILIQDMHITFGDGSDAGANYSFYVFFSAGR